MLNNITLTGRLNKKDARTGNYEGTPVVNFTVAVELGLTPKMAMIDGREQLVQVPATTFIECSAWGPEATAATSLTAGQEVTFKINQLGSKPSDYQGKLYSNITARVRDVVPGAKAKPKAAAETPAEAETDSIPF